MLVFGVIVEVYLNLCMYFLNFHGFSFFWVESVIQSEKNYVLRPGQIVLFHKPTMSATIELGMVLTVWRGIKAPKVFAGPVQISSCPALRILELSPADETKHPPIDWRGNAESHAWVVRMESVIAMLDCDEQPPGHIESLECLQNGVVLHGFTKWNAKVYNFTMVQVFQKNPEMVNEYQSNPVESIQIQPIKYGMILDENGYG